MSSRLFSLIPFSFSKVVYSSPPPFFIPTCRRTQIVKELNSYPFEGETIQIDSKRNG
jgi:hypothetical protein